MTDLHPFRSPHGAHVLLVDGSRIYDVDEDSYAEAAVGKVPAGLRDAVRTQYVDETAYRPGGLRALSLNVAQGCNMSCSYCYADEGRFGAHARLMSVDMGRMAAERFLNQVPPGQDAVLGYMGGEPLLNARVLHEVTRFAADLAARRNISLRFSVTTNGTLLRDEDITLLGDFPFSVAISLDGGRATNDAQRRLRNGQSAYDRTVEGIRKLTSAKRRPRHVSLRATVTPRSGELPMMLEDMFALGVDEAGFAPVLASPDPKDMFDAADFDRFLTGMIACGERAVGALSDRQRFPFSNFETALGEIHRGSHRPYPCGAAAGYASVSAEGGLFGCHRAIDDPAFAIGSIEDGADREAQRDFLERRHVLQQEPCRTCWARFLCGGGCHQEVLARGRVGCDYIRGWLEFCLSAYADLSSRIPDYFDEPETFFKDQSVEPFQ
ncbi:radical SAM protein [uncultured Roseibium sp.]|uniref:radical SAM/SPASM domain-containing protein n=1 Tax=uncultured Roseibium sp. TaxID=1936171 RepID=UPI00261B0523|nr:radical SAM protein [uncultured Roseibium sp.]